MHACVPPRGASQAAPQRLIFMLCAVDSRWRASISTDAPMHGAPLLEFQQRGRYAVLADGPRMLSNAASSLSIEVGLRL